jgi:uncharacterized protein YdeI (YjbR/CyaY-like superfamily)
MQKPSSPEAYIAQAPAHWQERLHQLREILLERSELSEAIKWAMPVYSIEKKNVATLFYAKAYVGVWFSQGALLSDPDGMLVNASPGKTVAQRQLRFGVGEAVDAELVRSFLKEAVENQQMGLEMEILPAAEPVIPDELAAVFKKEPALYSAYSAMPPYKQREFCESISGAKREETRQRRLEKAIVMIREGKGLSDKYRK